MMKNAYYIVETNHATSGWDMPEWHKNSVHNSLKAALARKAELLKLTKKEYDGSLTKLWYAKEIRIIECTRKVIR